MSTYQTAPRQYVQSVIDAMKEHGFAFLAMITMDSDNHPYHVTQIHTFAKHTRIFFHLPNKTMMVMLELVECFGEAPWTYHYWRGWVNVRWDRRAEYQHLLDTDWERVREMHPDDVGYFVGTAIKERSPFRMSNSGFEQTDTRSPEWLTAEQITAVFGEIKNNLSRFMYHKYIELQVTEFPPHYCFPECHVWFWEHFPIQRLLPKVERRIFGSKGVPEPR